MYREKRDKRSRTVFQLATEVFSHTSGVALAFAGTGPAYKVSVSSVKQFAYSSYGPDIAWFAGLGWFIAVALLSYAASLMLVFLFIQIVGVLAGRVSAYFS